MHRTRPGHYLAVGLTAALLTTTAACGGSQESSGGSSGGSDASSSSSSSAGSEASATPLTASDIGQRLSSAQKKAGTFSFDVTTDSGGQQVEGTGKADISGAQVASDVTLDVGGQQIQAIATGGVFYFKSAIFKTAKPWLKIDPSAKSGLGSVLGQLGANADPSRALAALGKASKVTAGGSKQIDGEQTTRYDVVLPTSALGSTLGYPETLLKELPDNLTYRLYVDGDDLVRRQDSSLTVRGTKVDTSITFDDYGEDVSVTAPPAGQVTTTAPGLQGLAG